MRRGGAAAGAVLLLAAALAGCTRLEADRGPLEVRPAVLELGRQTWDQKVTRQLTVRNHGPEPLHLTGIESDCRCSVPTFEPGPVPPGGRRTIEGAFDPQQIQGPFETKLRVLTAEGAVAEVPLRAEVEPPLHVEPMSLDVTLKPGEAEVGVVTVWAPKGLPDEVTPNVTGPAAAWVKAEVHRLDKRTAEVALRLDPPRLGSWYGRLTLVGAQGRPLAVAVDLRGAMPSPYALSRGHFNLALLMPKDPPGTDQVVIEGLAPDAIGGVDSTLTGTEVWVEEAEGAVTVQLRADPSLMDPAQGQGSGAVRVTLADEEAGVLVLPIYGGLVAGGPDGCCG